MTHDQRQPGGQVAADVVQVAVADAGGLDPDPHLAGAGLVELDLLQRQRCAGLAEHGREHQAVRPARPAAPRGLGALQLGQQRRAHLAGVEGERVGQRGELVVVEPAEQARVLVGHRLGERDVQQQRPHPVEASPGVRVEVGELARHQVLDGLGHLGDADAVAAPLVDGEALLLGHEGVEAAPVGRVRADRDEALAADVLVHPQRPAGLVAVVEVELVAQDAAQPGVALLVAAVDRPELADQDRAVQRARVLRALEELRLGLLGAVVRAPPEPGRHVVVQRPHRVLERHLEHAEVGRVRVAVEEEDVVGVDRADGRDEAGVEGPDDLAGLVGGLVQQVVARDPGVVLVVRGHGLPEVDDAVLEVPVLPEGRDVRRVVGVPVLVLRARQRVQVDDRVDAVGGQQVDHAVEVAEAVRLDLERRRVVLEVLVADGDPDEVEAGLGQERRVRLVEEAGEQALEERGRPVGADDLRHLGPHQRLVGRVAGDEVLHVQPAAQADPAQQQGLPVGPDERRT